MHGTRTGFNQSKGFEDVAGAKSKTNTQHSPSGMAAANPFNQSVTSQNTANIKGKLASLDV